MAKLRAPDIVLSSMVRLRTVESHRKTAVWVPVTFSRRTVTLDAFRLEASWW